MKKRANIYMTIWIFLQVVLVYVLLAVRTRYFYTDHGAFNYYNYLIEAFLHGRPAGAAADGIPTQKKITLTTKKI